MSRSMLKLGRDLYVHFILHLITRRDTNMIVMIVILGTVCMVLSS